MLETYAQTWVLFDYPKHSHTPAYSMVPCIVEGMLEEVLVEVRQFEDSSMSGAWCSVSHSMSASCVCMCMRVYACVCVCVRVCACACVCLCLKH